MRSQIIITVEHGETTDGLTLFAEHLVSERDWFGDGSLMILDYDVRVDIESEVTMPEEHEYRVTITTAKEQYEYVVSAPDEQHAKFEAGLSAAEDGWIEGTGVVSAMLLY